MWSIEPTFRRIVWPPSSVYKNLRAKNQSEQVAAELTASRRLPAIYELVWRESGQKGITREGWGRVCGGQQVAGENLYRIRRGEIQGYGVSIDPLALVLFHTGT
jgi:hypothetical protein